MNKNEKGHAGTVAGFGELITAISGFGASYNPSLPAISIAGLQEKKNLIDAAMAKVMVSLISLRNVTHRRAELFGMMSPLSTRIINALSVSGATKADVGLARHLVKKINGKRIGKLPSAEVNDTENPVSEDEGENHSPATHSASMSGFVNRTENFTTLATFVVSLPAYNPAEQDLSATSMQLYAESLKQANKTVDVAMIDLANARIVRDKLLFEPNNGACDTGHKVKMYIKSVYGGKSREYSTVSGIKLSN